MKFILFYVLMFLSVLLHGQIDFQLDIHRQNQILTEEIFELAVDRMGYLWIGTSDGVIRYDGHDTDRFQNEGINGSALNGNYVYDILPRPDSSVWVSTYGGGISIYQPYSNDFKTLFRSIENRSILENRVNRMHSISADTVLIHYRGIDQVSGGFSLLDNDGKLLSHHLTGVDQDNGYFLRFLDVAIDSQDIWIPGKELFQIDRSSFSFTSVPFPFTIDVWNDVKKMEVLNKSTLLIGTKNGLYTYNSHTKEWATLLKKKYVISMETCRDKVYILCRKQIFILDKKTQEITTFLDAEHMYKNKSFRMNDIKINDEDLWLASNKGLFRFELEEQTVKILKLELDQNGLFRSVKKIGTRPAIGTKLFLSFDGQIVEQVGPKNAKLINRVSGLAHGVILNFLKNDNHLFATDASIYHYNANLNEITKFIEGTALEDMLIDESIWSLYNNRVDSILWIGTRLKGLFKYDIGQDTFIQFRHEEGNPLSLCFDRYMFKISPGLDGNLWISTDKGLSVINPNTNQFVSYPKIMDLLSDYIVHDNVAGDRFMWIGTRDHGLFRYDIKNDEVKTYTIKEGLPFTGADRLLFKNGKLFFSTIKGICILEESSDKIRLYDESSGIDENALYYCKMTIDDDFLMVSGTKSSVIYQIPLIDSNDDENLSPILIKYIKTSTSDTSFIYYNPSDNINLTAKEDNLLVSFTNVDYDKRKIKYRYKLNGYDTRWISSGESRVANYSHLPGGSFQFIIQASLAGGRWEQERLINIAIDYLWYQTWWFYSFCFLLGLLTFGFLYKLSLDKIKLRKSYELMLSQAELKALRAQMNPHFVFNSLNSIKSFIIENDRKNASEYLNKFSKLMRLILNHSKSNLIPLSEEIQAIQLYIDMERLRFSTFDFELEIDEKISTEHLMIPPMIIQPYLENAIWHGLLHKVTGSGILMLKIKKSDKEGLGVVIRDNGVGRVVASELKSKSVLQKKSHGMTITKERLKLSQPESGKESVKIIDLYDQEGLALGTEIRIFLPYTNSENV